MFTAVQFSCVCAGGECTHNRLCMQVKYGQVQSKIESSCDDDGEWFSF